MTRHFVQFLFLLTLMSGEFALAQGIPSSMPGVKGFAGVGFADFVVQTPSADMKIDRGTYYVMGAERGFDFLNLYITLALAHMNAGGTANYDYTNLSSSNTYSVDDIAFDSKVSDLSLGLKLKLIDDYWFRPYIEGGGIGSYHAIEYTNKKADLAASGNDFKTKDVVMSSGYYGEAGVEIQFSDRFGVKLGARESRYQTKKIETLDNRRLLYTSETYYFAILVGFE